jgi:hypothetical protein
MSRRDIDGRTSSGARASNAGDLYHFAWCARAMLNIMHPRTDLGLIVMAEVVAAQAYLPPPGHRHCPRGRAA